MLRNWKAICTFVFLAGMPVFLHAEPQAATAETLNPKQVRELEASAVTAADHRRLAAYYQAQADVAEKKLAEAQELYRVWAPMEHATKTPDPYPHARRLVGEYSAQVEKYTRLAEDHLWAATKYDVYEKYRNAPINSATANPNTPVSSQQ